jgi:hypothetical protein
MPEAAYSSIMTEAVAVFHDVESFQAAIDDLLPAGFDHADINVLAHEDTIRSKLGPMYKSTAEFEDDPDAPRIGYIPNETIGNAEGAIIGAGVYLPAMFGVQRWPLLAARCSAYLRRPRLPVAPAACSVRPWRATSATSMPSISTSISITAAYCCGSERGMPNAKSKLSRFRAATRPMTSICIRFPSAPARIATSRASARASSISLIENTLSISFVGPRRSQRSMRVIFEPSRLKLYMSPFGSMIKAMIGLVRLLVSIEPSAPIVTTTIEPSTPTFQP